eukprot:13478987-Heterocapsa_arctica.AAC.1
MTAIRDDTSIGVGPCFCCRWTSTTCSACRFSATCRRTYMRASGKFLNDDWDVIMSASVFGTSSRRASCRNSSSTARPSSPLRTSHLSRAGPSSAN